MILPVSGFAQTADEYAIKATYIARFTNFVDWPQEAGASTMVISVIGDAPFRDTLEKAFAAVKLDDIRVVIRRISSIEEIEDSQILFISGSEKKNCEKILAFTKGKPILTISDSDGLAAEGVGINFYENKSKILFEINPAALKNAGLHASSLLLDNARMIDPEEKQ